MSGSSTGQLDLSFDGWQVEERISSRSHSIRVEVRSPTEVRLVIPRFVARQAARDFLKSREPWIRETIAAMRLKQAEAGTGPSSPQLRWDGSDQLPLRGALQPLIIVPAQMRRPVVRLHDGIRLYCSSRALAQPETLLPLLREVLRREALQDAQKLLRTEAVRLGVQYEGPRIADQKTLWGSCTPAGLISLNWRLVMAPAEVFRYVVVHELCHRVHLDHSDRFWALLQQQMPDYEPQRRWLREHGGRLHWWLS